MKDSGFIELAIGAAFAAAVTLGGAGGLAVLSGCSGKARLSVPDEEYASLEGTPEALKVMFDGMNGLISNGKASADMKSAHWAIREEQEKEITARSKEGLTFWQKVAAGFKAQEGGK
jgi:hypothetical protein